MAEAHDWDTASSVADDEMDFDQVTLSDVHSYLGNQDVHTDQHLGQDITAAQASKAIQAADEGALTATTSDGARRSASCASSLRSIDLPTMPVLDAGPAPPDYSAATAWRKDMESQRSREQSAQAEVKYDRLFNFGQKAPKQKQVQKSRRWYWILPGMIWVITTVILAVRLATQSRRMRHWAWHGADESPLSEFHDYIRPERFHASTADCTFDSYSAFTSFNFEDASNFTFVEDLGPSDDAFSGNVVVGTGPYSQKWPIVVWINTATANPWSPFEPTAIKSSNRLDLQLPQLWRDAKSDTYIESEVTDMDQTMLKPCTDVWIGIFLRSNVMENLNIRTTNLNVDINPRASGADSPGGFLKWWMFRVLDTVDIAAGQGNVKASSIHARDISVATKSGSIEGAWGATDEIRMATHSGDISTYIAMWLDDFEGEQHQGSSVKLTTSTKSGRTNLTLMSNEEPLLPLKAYHSSISGSMRLDYSSDCRWDGKFDINTSNGTVDVNSIEGKDIELFSTTHAELGGQHVSGTRGTGNSRWEVETNNGNVEVHFDDLETNLRSNCLRLNL